MALSLRDAAFALDAAGTDPWSLRTSVGIPVYPPLPPGPISVKVVAGRFSPAGAALRTLASGTANAWSHLNLATIVGEISDRLRDPLIMKQQKTGLCGPFAILMELARRDPVRYVIAARELLETGALHCPGGRVITAESELRQEPLTQVQTGQVDWLLGATLRDDENIWEDVDDDANGLETMTFWTEQRGWIRDVLDLSGGDWETCFWWGDVDCMKQAEAAVKAGGVAHLLIDANMLTPEPNDSEEDMWLRRSYHEAGKKPTAFPQNPTHSQDDDLPPDHWVAYLGGLNLGSDPDDDDPITVLLWSWGSRFEVTGTVEAFTEYLYGVATGY